MLIHDREQINLRLNGLVYQKHQFILTGLADNVVKPTVYCSQWNRNEDINL